jgi:hypothetical protein
MEPASTNSAPQTPIKIAAPLVKKISKFNLKSTAVLVGAVVLVILLGVGTGWLLSGKGKTIKTVTSDSGKEVVEAGVSDTSTFKDTAEGTLEEGGISGEGTHHLVREGGDSQNVYLTSTVIDLQSFVGKKVKVWGQTLSGKKAGWLMDVGKVQVTK